MIDSITYQVFPHSGADRYLFKITTTAMTTDFLLIRSNLFCICLAAARSAKSCAHNTYLRHMMAIFDNPFLRT